MKLNKMNKIFYLILLSIFCLTVISCAKKDESSVPTDTTDNSSVTLNITTFVIDTKFELAELTAVATPGFDNTPNYTFSSTKAGTITYGGSCSSSTTVAVAGNNTITFNTLNDEIGRASCRERV